MVLSVKFVISRVRCDEILSLDREVWKISQDGELAAHLLLLDVHGHKIVGPGHPHAYTEDVAYKPEFLIIPAGLLGTAWTVSKGEKADIINQFNFGGIVANADCVTVIEEGDYDILQVLDSVIYVEVV